MQPSENDHPAAEGRAEDGTDNGAQAQAREMRLRLDVAEKRMQEAEAAKQRLLSERDDLLRRLAASSAKGPAVADGSPKRAGQPAVGGSEQKDVARDRLEAELTEARLELKKERDRRDALVRSVDERGSQLDHLKERVDSLKVDLKESEYLRQEAENARKLAEDALNAVQSKLEEYRHSGPAEAPRLVSRESMLDELAGRKRGSRFFLPLAAAGGALFLLLALEAASILQGKGELVSALLGRSGMTGTGPQEGAPEPTAFAEVSVPLQPAMVPPSDTESEKPEVLSTPTPGAAPELPRETELAESPDLPAGTEIRDRLKGGGQGPIMVKIPRGALRMGAAHNVMAYDERPLHPVNVGTVYVGKYETTFEEYDRFAKATGRRLPADRGWGRGRRPVMNVSWEDARAYVAWLSRQSGKKYRLPSEAEWEYAASAGTQTTYWWGFRLDENRANCFDCGSRWDGLQTAPVGSFQPNPFGLHDTAGNVSEWLEDCYHSSYEGAPIDGSAWAESGCPKRVARGGSYNSPATSLRTTKRQSFVPDFKFDTLGFRVVRDP